MSCVLQASEANREAFERAYNGACVCVCAMHVSLCVRVCVSVVPVPLVFDFRQAHSAPLLLLHLCSPHGTRLVIFY